MRIWSRQRWSFDWILKNVSLKRQFQFFTAYRNIYEIGKSEIELENIGHLTDHHLMAILFQIRWEILVGLERHFVRKPPGPEFENCVSLKIPKLKRKRKF